MRPFRAWMTSTCPVMGLEDSAIAAGHDGDLSLEFTHLISPFSSALRDSSSGRCRTLRFEGCGFRFHSNAKSVCLKKSMWRRLADAAGNEPRLAGDPGRIGGSEEQRGGGDVGRLADSA